MSHIWFLGWQQADYCICNLFQGSGFSDRDVHVILGPKPLIVTSKECAYYQDESTNVLTKDIWLYLLQPSVQDIKVLIRVFMAKVKCMCLCVSTRTWGSSILFSSSSVCLLCKDNPSNPNNLLQSCRPSRHCLHQRQTVFWTLNTDQYKLIVYRTDSERILRP